MKALITAIVVAIAIIIAKLLPAIIEDDKDLFKNDIYKYDWHK